MITETQPSGSTVATPSQGGGDPSPRRALGALRRLRLRQALLIGSFGVMILYFSLRDADAFLSTGNLQNLINDLPVLGMLAISVTVVLILGEFDLSVPYIGALTSVVVAILATQTGLPIIVAVLIGLLVAIAAGTVNGSAVGFGKASPFIVTLAVGSIAMGLETLVQTKIDLGATQISRQSIPEGLLALSDTQLLGFDIAAWIFVLATLVLGLVVAFTTWGRYLSAIGGNEQAAHLAGVPVRQIKVTAFIVAGVLAGIAGVLFTARQGYFTNAFPPYLLPAYAAAFFGAAAVGRRGFSVPATLFGVFYLQTLENGLRITNEPLWVISVVQGAVLLVTVLIAKVGSKA